MQEGYLAGFYTYSVAMPNTQAHSKYQPRSDDHTRLNSTPSTIAIVGGIKKLWRIAPIWLNTKPSSFSFPFRTKATHCRCFVSSSANSLVNASGVSVGMGVRRRSNVAAMARPSRLPSKVKCWDKYHRQTFNPIASQNEVKIFSLSLGEV